MKRISPGFRNDIDLAAAEFAIFGVEITGENAEFGDGVEVGNDGRAHVDVFFYVTSVHDEGICEFPLAIDGNSSGIQIAGGSECAGTHVLNRLGCDGSDRSDSGLKREQVGIAAPV